MLTNFRHDRRGNIAMMFAIAAIPVIAAIGAAVDYSNAYQEKIVVQDALDSAALAANRLIATASDDSDVEAEAQNFFTANLAGRVDPVPTIHFDLDGSTITLTTTLSVPTNFLGLVGVNDIGFDLLSQSVSGGTNLEVAVVLDITLSMYGSKISDLKDAATDLVETVIQDQQTPYYSKVALVPYSIGVNVGSYADSVRGAVTSAVTITGASWMTSSSQKTISSITRANPAQVTTTSSHGYSTGNVVYISGLNDNGSNSFADNLNGNYYTITRVSNTQFTLNGVNSSNYRSFTSGSGSADSGSHTRKCIQAQCQLVLTESASGTPYASGTQIFLQSFSPSNSGSLGRQLNENVYTVGTTTSTTFSLSGTLGPNFSDYSSGGSACQTTGCEYYRFTNADNGITIQHISNCVTERTGTEAYTDAAPSTALVGRNYPSSTWPCPSNEIIPLTSNEGTLTTAISNLSVTGSTAGQIGAAWGWYMLSPNFGYLWPDDSSVPADYDQEDVTKVMVFMTDGAFNTAYCNGVVSDDSADGIISDSQRINCDATNGDPFSQAEALCAAARDAGVIIYTVGFQVGSEPGAADFLADCATDSDHAFLPESGTALQADFAAIGTDISQLRLSQ